MNTETALAHLEAFIAGGDELGDVPEDDAIEALQLIRETLEKQEKEIERLRKQVSTAAGMRRRPHETDCPPLPHRFLCPFLAFLAYPHAKYPHAGRFEKEA